MALFHLTHVTKSYGFPTEPRPRQFVHQLISRFSSQPTDDKHPDQHLSPNLEQRSGRQPGHQPDRQPNQRMILGVESLSINQGEILAIIGPSGAGKSTLLRLLNFLEFPTTGTIEFDGRVYSSTTQPSLAERRRVTTVFQTPVLLSRSVYDNVAYGLRLRNTGIRRLEETDLVSSALAKVGLAQLANQQARTLSGGEMQRVALARAIVLEPDVLLLDEPTANLDPQNVAIIESIAGKLNQDLGTTIVLVTHNLFQARRLSQRMVFLLDGRVVEVGKTETLFTNPLEDSTRAFMSGDMIY